VVDYHGAHRQNNPQYTLDRSSTTLLVTLVIKQLPVYDAYRAMYTRALPRLVRYDPKEALNDAGTDLRVSEHQLGALKILL
jgi:hypothetical protein